MLALIFVAPADAAATGLPGRGRGWRGRGGRVAAAPAAGDGVAAGLQATTKDAARSMPGNERAAEAAELGVYGRGLLIKGADRT